MNRRELLAALAGVGVLPRRALSFTRYPVHLPKPTPYQGLLARLDPRADTFACEEEAAVVEARLREMMTSRSLPLAADFHGVSPLPVRYKRVGPGLATAEFGSAALDFSKWIDSLGHVHRANFFALPGGLVRYEIKSEGAYRVGLWKQTWKDGWLAEFSPVSETLATATEPFFEDVTAHVFHGVDSFERQLLRGNRWWRSRLDAAAGTDIYGANGIAVGDIDNDGADEIYVCQSGGLPNRLYKTRADGTLADITEKSRLGVLDDTTCALFVDFRNSGKEDLVVLRSGGPLLFLNHGDGTFAHVPDAFHFRNPPQGSFTGMAAADYDRDGRVDLYLCTYVYFQSEDQYRYPLPYHDARNGPPNFLFHNRLTASGGWFEDVTAETGVDQNNDRYSFAPAWCDFDGDGWPDLYVANDFGRSNLYRNRGGRFRDEAAQAGVENMAPGMSAAWFDYDGDGLPDLYVSNMWTEAGQRVTADPAFAPGRELRRDYRSHTKGNSLFRNRGDGTFLDAGAAEGVEMGRWAWCADGFDFDNDGATEILIAAGMLTNGSQEDLNSFFWRQVVARSPIDSKPAADYENGWNAINQLIREDYTWCGRQPNVFYKRIGSRFYDFSGVSGLDFADDSRAFAVTDIDGDGNLDIVLKSRLAPQVRVLRNNCGAARHAIAIRLRGTKSNRDAIGARVEVNGRVQFVTAGSGYLAQHTKQLHFGLVDRAEASVRIVWPSGLRQEFHGLRPGSVYQIEEGSAELRSTPFRAPVAYAAVPELKPENAPAFAATWLVEPVPLPDQRRGPGFLLLFSGERPEMPRDLSCETVDLLRSPADVAVQYSLFQRYLFDLRGELELPLLLLIDDRSRAHRIYREVPAAAALREDFRIFQSGRSRELALPFPGAWYSEPRRSYFKLGAAFYWAGYPDQAIPYLEEVVRRAPGNLKALIALARIHYDGGRWQPALDHYQSALAVKPDSAQALLGAGESYAKLNDPAQAEAMFRRALETDPSSADAANQLGLLLAEHNRAAEAKQWFERAIHIDREHTGAINNLAVLYVKLGQTNDAIAAFQYGIEVAPEDEMLYMNLGRLYVSLGDRARARELMHKLLERKPANPAAMRALQELDAP